MAAIKFLLKSTNNPAPIYIRLTGGRLLGQVTKFENEKKVDVMAKTNFVINPSDWHKEKQRPKNLQDEDFKILNSDLLELKSKLLKHYNKSNGQVPIDTKWLKEFLNPSQASLGLPTSLLQYLDSYISIKKKTVSKNSIKKYNVIKAKLQRYEQELKTTLQVKDIGPQFQKSFEAFCDKHNYSHDTVTMEVRFLKTICRHAANSGLEVHPKMESIMSKYAKKEEDRFIILDFEELQRIKSLNLNESLDNARDWLLISCYTGQRVSDFLRFNKEMIRSEKNRKGETVQLIEFEQQKTGKTMTLPLHKEVVTILDKRNGDFPRQISDVKYNEYIKSVCREAKITELVPGSRKAEIKKNSGIYRKETGIFPKCELVTSHIGRRSFATNFYGLIPTSLLIAATGHSTEQMFLNYIGKSSSDRAKELAEYF